MALQHHIGTTEFVRKMKKTVIVFLLSVMCLVAFPQQKVKNVILLIGDGMGLAQSYAAYMANGDSLAMFSMPVTGFSITTCADRKVTDSGAGGTAIATGHKANYHAIGLDGNGYLCEHFLNSILAPLSLENSEAIRQIDCHCLFLRPYTRHPGKFRRQCERP